MLPVMTGLGATEYIMAHCPTPILIVSSSTNRGELFKTYEALAAGAVDVLEKPLGDEEDGEWERRFIATVKLVSRIRVITHLRARLGRLGQPRIESQPMALPCASRASATRSSSSAPQREGLARSSRSFARWRCPSRCRSCSSCTSVNRSARHSPNGSTARPVCACAYARDGDLVSAQGRTGDHGSAGLTSGGEGRTASPHTGSAAPFVPAFRRHALRVGGT